jgi:uncharacterized protein (DUF2141 family)
MSRAGSVAAGLGLGLLVATFAARAQPGVVEVVVAGVRDGRGHVRVAVCTRTEFLSERCARNGMAPARPGTVVVIVTGVPPGTYAVQAWHDENDNGRIDRDWLGIPREGVGFSQDPPLLLGPPSFGGCAFQVGPDGGRATLRLRYLKS